MILKNLNLILFLCGFSLLVSCGDGSKKSADEEKDTTLAGVSEGPPIICLWSSVTIKASPEQNGKYITAINLGETATFLGETITDSTIKNKPKEFVKLKLKDGTIGWVQSNFMAINAKSYAVKNDTKLYKRPDILSGGKDQFQQLQFVVSLEEKDGWAKIKGKKGADSWFKEGWVKLENLTSSEADITVAILTEIALAKETPEKKLEALNEIIGNSELSSSIFISNVNNYITELSNRSIDEIVPAQTNENQGE